MLVTEQFQFLLSFIELFDHTMEINGNRNRLVTNNIQNILFMLCIIIPVRTTWGWVNDKRFFILCGLSLWYILYTVINFG